MPGAEWHGDGVTNKTVGKMYGHKGVVLHIEQGSQHGSDSWFHNPQAQVSAHFGVAKDGTIFQWVDTDDTAWAEMAGNHYWISVENEGYSGQPLTQAQEESNAKILGWAHKRYGFALQVTADPTGQGLGHHAMGGADWGGHEQCPGEPVINQKTYIVNRARALTDAPVDLDAHQKHLLHEKNAGGLDAHEEHLLHEQNNPSKPGTPAWYHRPLAFHAGQPMLIGDDVKVVQRKVQVKADGVYGPATAAKVRGYQTVKKMPVDGTVGPATARTMGA